MSVTVHHLRGEKPMMFQIDVDADTSKAYAKLLKRAGKLVAELDPDSIRVSGPYWQESTDSFCLDLFVSNPK